MKLSAGENPQPPTQHLRFAALHRLCRRLREQVAQCWAHWAQPPTPTPPVAQSPSVEQVPHGSDFITTPAQPAPPNISAAQHVPFGPLGYVTFKRTYARRLPQGGTEEFTDTIDRVLRACQEQLKCGFTPAELEDARQLFLSLKCSVSGRFLWQLGSPTVWKNGLASLMSCAFVTLSTIQDFTFMFDLLMLGVGVGVSCEHRYVQQLPLVCGTPIHIQHTPQEEAAFVVPDTRQGWTQLIQHVLEAYLCKHSSFTYSTALIRPEGTPLHDFGGVASGPACLITGVQQLCGVLDKRRGQRLTSVDAMDMACILGGIVCAGNIRRSAIMVLGDCWDTAYLRAKRWDVQTIPAWRAFCNTSVVCNDVAHLPPEFWEGYLGNGEPYGLCNLALMQSTGRVGDPPSTLGADPAVRGCNPCAEMGLAPREMCCLAECFLPNVAGYSELVTITKLLYRICKHALHLPCHDDYTGRIMRQNCRIGVGVSGYLQATEEQRSWLPSLYKELRWFDVQYSAQHKFNPSIKLTTVKPSGTLSLLPSVTSGAHAAHAQWYIRRIRFPATSSLLPVCATHGYSIESQRDFAGKEDPTVKVVSFPVATPPGTTLSASLTAIDQLQIVMRLQKEWADNGVSCTVSYNYSELPGIKAFLQQHYEHSIKSVSFLARVSGFTQMPLEEITEQQFLDMTARCHPIHSMYHIHSVHRVEAELTMEDEYIDDGECTGGHCPVR